MHDSTTLVPDADALIEAIPDLADLIPLPELPKHITAAPGGRRVHKHVPYRWHDEGLRGAKLRAIKVPGAGLCTTLLWFREFMAAAGQSARAWQLTT